jgi:hypothetical protein
MIVVDTIAATICFLGSCYPALVGQDTPKGEYQVTQRLTSDPGYGGDVLQFHETPDMVYAIHRVWTLNPAQKREQRLRSSDPKQRQSITKGCINVAPDVYAKLVDCCSEAKVVIK